MSFEHHGPIFIAEVGVNHNGSLEHAKKLVIASKNAGATIVKFQTFVAERVVTKKATMADYQKQNLGKDESQYLMLKKLELSYDDFTELKKYCDENDIHFLSTGFDLESLRFLAGLKPKFWKVPSGEITNLPYLEFIAAQSGLIFISTGMADANEVEEAYNLISEKRKSRDGIYVMHCTTQYPANILDVNLDVLTDFKKRFDGNIGYSDHTMGIEVSLGAIALGAQVIEKHITLDPDDVGPDHKASVTPDQFHDLVKLGKNIQVAIGSPVKKPTAVELKNRLVVRRSIVASKQIRKGEIFTVENLDVKRPGTGLSPMNWYNLIGKKSSCDYEIDDLIDEKL